MVQRAEGDIPQAARLLSLGAAFFALVCGSLVLLGGWALEVSALRAPVQGLPPMSPHSALLLLLLGAALWLRLPAEAPRLRQRLGAACATLATLLGLAALSAYALKPVWLSQLGQPSLKAALCFCLLGLALLLVERQARPGLPWVDLLVPPALLIALVAFNGYIHGALNLVDRPQLRPTTGMSLPAALGVLALGAGLFAARPQRGLMARLTGDTLGGFFARTVLPLLLLLPPLAGVLLELLHVLGLISAPAENALFSTVASTGGLAIVLFSARVLDRLDAERRRAETEREQLLACAWQATAEAEAERALLRAVLDHAPVGVLFVALATDMALGNPTLRVLLGQELDPERGSAQALEGLRHADGQPLRPEELPTSRARAGLKVEGEEYVLVRPDGTRTPVLVNAAPVREPSGELRGLVLTFQDISARRELERFKEEYVSLISHDLRTPLHTISLRLDILLRQLRAQGLQKEGAAAETIQQGVRRMGGMIGELLEGTRLESGRVELHREEVGLERLLTQVLERDVPPSERERFRLEQPAPVPLVLADAPRLERVVVNLLTNALKYSPPATPVEVRLEQEASQVVVSVRDEGPGLSPEDAARVFQKYYRTRSSEKKSDGLGLGLYISRLIVEAHGGRIWVESTPGQGATFTFTLPLAPPEERSVSRTA